MIETIGTERSGMKQMTMVDRSLLLATGLLAAYQIVFGVEGSSAVALWAYTVAFGVLLLAGLLLIILGFEALASPLVVIAATMIPLALSLGLVWEHFPGWRMPYLVFAIAGFAGVTATRLVWPGRGATITLAVVHGVAGLLIFGLPLYLSLRGTTPAGFALVGVGGALIGVAGLLLSFLKMGRPLLPENTILALLPGLLLLVTATFVAGFALI
ncbi:MAG: hypothetical protein RRC07_10790 [Anaerolineae bacterium]|nr:hypothetical protein [Anaerolineae bacterium]